MTIKVTYNVTDVYVTQDVSPVYINVSYSSGSGGGAAVWGGITGTLSDQTDLQSALNAKFDDPTGTTSQYLRGDGTLATFPTIPSGTVTSVALTMPTAFSVANSPITSSGTLAVTATGDTTQYIAGDGSLATFPSLTGFVPYTGATGDVNLGTHRILAQNATIASSGSGDTVTLNHSSGSGIGLNITKGGNGEGLYINKTGGSGNAATIIGTINATSFVKSGGTSSQFLKADGSVDSSVYVPTSREITINGVTYDLSANRSWTVSGGISGSGASGQVAYWTGTSAQSGSNNLFWDAANGRLGIGTNVPTDDLYIQRTSATAGAVGLRARNLAATGEAFFAAHNEINEFIALEVFGSSWASLGNANKATVTSSTSKGMAFLVYSGNANAHFSIQTTTSLTERFRLFGNTGNVLIQNGGTFTDGGQRLQVQGTTLLNGNVTFSSSTGMTWDANTGGIGIGTNVVAGTDSINIVGSNGNRKSIVVQNTNSLGNASFYFQNNRGSFASYGGLLHAGSAYTLSFLGTNAADKTYLISDGASSTGMGVGTLVSTELFFGTNNARRLTITASTGNVLINSTTDSGERLQVTGTAKITSKLSMGAGTTSAAQINLASSTAPTSPANGDIWFDGTDIKMRIGGVTKTFTLL